MLSGEHSRALTRCTPRAVFRVTLLLPAAHPLLHAHRSEMSKLDAELVSKAVDKILAYSAGKEVEGVKGVKRNFVETIELQVRAWAGAAVLQQHFSGGGRSFHAWRCLRLTLRMLQCATAVALGRGGRDGGGFRARLTLALPPWVFPPSGLAAEL